MAYERELICLFINSSYSPAKTIFQTFAVEFRYNSQRLQNRDSEMCGQYCVYYVWMRNRGYSMKEIVNSFSGNLAHNDKIVSQFYNKLLRRVN